MAYQFRRLEVLCLSSSGFTMWHYATEDSVKDLIEPGYWNGASALLKARDMIVVNAGPDLHPFAGFLVVTANASREVRVAALHGTTEKK